MAQGLAEKEHGGTASPWGKSVAVTGYLSRCSWVPLDVVALNPRCIQELGFEINDVCSVAVDVSGLRLSLFAIADTGVEHGDALLPSWLEALLGFLSDGVVAKVTSCRPACDKQCHLHIEGPWLAETGVSPLASFLFWGQSHLKSTLLRQLARAGVRQSPGACFGVRVSGHIGVFRIVTNAESGGGSEETVQGGDEGSRGKQDFVCHVDNAGESALRGECRVDEVLKPASLIVRQPLHFPSGELLASAKLAAVACLSALSVKSMSGSNGSDAPSPRWLLCDGMPPIATLPAVLWSLRSLLGVSAPISHLPLCQCIWELAVEGSGIPTLRTILTGFISNLAPAEGGLLVLWGLDGPLPLGPSKLLSSAIAPLRSAKCTVLGLATSRANVPSCICELFELSNDRLAVHDLGLSSTSVATKENGGGVNCQHVDEVPVAGCSGVLRELKTCVVNYYEHSELFGSMGVSGAPRVLIYGPAGSGKTHMARWLCAELATQGIASRWLWPGEVWSKYLGESEERLRTAFAEAAEASSENCGAGVVLIIEGLDQLAPKSSTSARDSEAVGGFRDRLVATLLVSLDGVDSPGRMARGSGRGLGIVATSNTPPEKLDSRITRPGRMDRWILVDLPDTEQRMALLEHFIEEIRLRTTSLASFNRSRETKLSSQVLAQLTEASDGMSASSLRVMALDAWSFADNDHTSSQELNWPEVLDRFACRPRPSILAAPRPLDTEFSKQADIALSLAPASDVAATAPSKLVPFMTSAPSLPAPLLGAEAVDPANIPVPSSDDEDAL
eukprot:TRINITY_DN21007_c0_g1_i1.p1 TRINITY_DN21007_c0_g1~~TRINITY_DN21007_c0_g1_i1.p1  ORF type:complete len:787 (+),score=88.11 TRINITY_DN21007_c0_g1_i1:105-2465(+)